MIHNGSIVCMNHALLCLLPAAKKHPHTRTKTQVTQNYWGFLTLLMKMNRGLHIVLALGLRREYGHVCSCSADVGKYLCGHLRSITQESVRGHWLPLPGHDCIIQGCWCCLVKLHLIVRLEALCLGTPTLAVLILDQRVAAALGPTDHEDSISCGCNEPLVYFSNVLFVFIKLFVLRTEK